MNNYVSIQVAANNASKALTTLRSYGVATKKLEIGDAPKALVALRSHGLSEKEAQEIIDVEGIIAIHDYDREQNNSLSPELFEIFGIQHVVDALSYAYLYMTDFNLEWNEYKEILNALLQVYKPEELISNPEYIRYFINNLKLDEEEMLEKLKELENESIISMASYPKADAK